MFSECHHYDHVCCRCILHAPLALLDAYICAFLRRHPPSTHKYFCDPREITARVASAVAPYECLVWPLTTAIMARVWQWTDEDHRAWYHLTLAQDEGVSHS